MLNNLTDCEDGDGGANPGEQWSGGGGEGSQCWVRGGAGAASFREELRTDRAVDAGGGLELSSIGMRYALSEVLECAAPGGRAGAEGLLPAAWGQT